MCKMCLLAQWEWTLIDDAISVVRQAMSLMLSDSGDAIRGSFRRGRLYNDDSVGVECRHDDDSDSSALSRWVHGPVISRYMRQVCVALALVNIVTP